MKRLELQILGNQDNPLNETIQTPNEMSREISYFEVTQEDWNEPMFYEIVNDTPWTERCFSCQSVDSRTF